MNKILKKLGVATTIASLFAASAVPALAAVSNGSFETGDLTDPVFTTLLPGDTNLANWTVVSGNIDYIGTYWTASDGNRSLDMTGYFPGTISQDVPTTVGAVYTVTFDLSGNPAGGDITTTLRVDATGNTSTDFTYDIGDEGNTLVDMKWKEKAYTFTATAANTTLTFASLTEGFFGPALDNVAIEQSLPTNKDECKKGGWESFGVFKNQGQCVAFVASGGKNIH